MKKQTKHKIATAIILSIIIYMSYIGNNLTILYSYYSDYDTANLYGVLYATINYIVNFITISLIPFIIKKCKNDFFNKNVKKIYAFNGIFWIVGSIPLFSILYQVDSAGLGLLGATIFSIISYCFFTSGKSIKATKDNKLNKTEKNNKNLLTKEKTKTNKNCSKCGKEIEDYWKFCNYCGNEIIKGQNTIEILYKQESNIKSENGGKILENKEKDVLKLLDYKKLLDEGAITQEEYDKKKKEFLGD